MSDMFKECHNLSTIILSSAFANAASVVYPSRINFLYAYQDGAQLSDWQGGDITTDYLRKHNFTSQSPAVFSTEELPTIILNANGGKFTQATSPKIYVVPGIALPHLNATTQIPTRDTYNFEGFFDEAEGGTKYYNSDGTSAHPWNKEEKEVTLYAHWEKAPTPPAPPAPPTPTPDPDNPKPEEEQGWNYNESGGWYYVFDNDGNTYNDGWHWIEDTKFGAHWYFFKDTGFIAINQWIFTDAWYYVSGSGSMNVGTWNWINNAWYGFNWNGTMCKGWIYDSGYNNWFYCDPTTGAMYTNCWSFINGSWYGFWANGEMCRGWVWDSSYRGWFYCSPSDGHMYTNGWYTIDNTSYYFNVSGLLV